MDILIVPASVALTIIVLSLLTKKWDTGEKIDQGFVLCYWKLSYRRKFIRTLWMIPFAAIAIFSFYTVFQSYLWTCCITFMAAALLLIQAAYNYKKWKHEMTASDNRKGNEKM